MARPQRVSIKTGLPWDVDSGAPARLLPEFDGAASQLVRLELVRTDSIVRDDDRGDGVARVHSSALTQPATLPGMRARLV